uniref:Uncharacterized protein n=1 Tax=Daucus carota subsp. sativus TaxID=79200 RepID=A0A164UT23_DAUCS
MKQGSVLKLSTQSNGGGSGSVLYTSPMFTSPGSSCLSNVSPNDTILKDLQHSNPTRERKPKIPKSTVVSKAVKRVRRLDTTKEGMPRTNLFCEEDEEDGNTEEAVHHTQGDPDALYEDDDMGYDGGECDLKNKFVD